MIIRSVEEWAKELCDRWVTTIYGEDFLGDFVNRTTADSLIQTVADGMRAYAAEQVLAAEARASKVIAQAAIRHAEQVAQARAEDAALLEELAKDADREGGGSLEQRALMKGAAASYRAGGAAT